MVHLLLVVIYLAFIGLGLPDSLLGAAWPLMYGPMGVPVSWAGGISMIISLGTVISSLNSDRLTRALGAGKVTAISTAMTMLALFGFSVSREYWMLCLLAVPYGLGAGSVDAALNNYVALHYASRHMSWLHCMWGVGASIGPMVLTRALAGSLGWDAGYRHVALMQLALAALLFLSLPLWKHSPGEESEAEGAPAPLRLPQVLAVPGAKAALATFFCYCALEQTAGLWGASYLNLHWGLSSEEAAAGAGLFYMGITAGRAVCGFITLKLSDRQMVRLGCGVIGLGVLALALPLGVGAAKAGLVLVGVGCAPIFPSLLHATPDNFGAERSQALVGVQMASAYVGTCLAPPVFGLLAGWLGTGLLPVYLLTLLAVMAAADRALCRTVDNARARA